MTNDVYIVDALRTPVGKANRGAFKHTRPDDLLSHTIKGLMAKYSAIDWAEVDDVIIGCAMPEAEQGMNVARNALLLAGLPDTVPGMTINRFCCSGVQTVALAADKIALGQAEMMIAGGTESMSMVPLGGHKCAPNPAIFNDEHIAIAYGMGLTAEIVAKRYDIDRAHQDDFALESHRRAAHAIEQGFFDKEILPFTVTSRGANLSAGEYQLTEKTVTHDEGPRSGSTSAQLAKLKSPFSRKGAVTAATSSQMSDGAGAVLLVSEKMLKKYNLTPMAKFRSYAVAGVPPEVMGIGPVKAIPKALEQAKLTLDDIDWIELNEAFAAQSLAVINELGLDRDKVNPQGGAIALGHPLGATGAIRLATLLYGMQRTKQRYGMVTMCIGAGMGAAGIFEMVR